ncbi:MAG: CoA-binding protein [Candidatus Micrarchaeota archaeon]|nr:CoA-binding protein [Candidatus Micrarchaeota archaeon]
MFELSKNFLYAIVGATTNKEKYGYKVLSHLKKKGFLVIGINPKYKKIEEIDCFSSLKECPFKIDVVVFVVQPSISLKVLQECLELKINKVWFQPGSSSPETLEFCKKNSIDFIADSCIIKSTTESD